MLTYADGADVEERGEIDVKTYRLDRAQVRRAYLLSGLAAAEWDPSRFAEAQGHGSLGRIIDNLDDADLGWMVRQDWRERLKT